MKKLLTVAIIACIMAPTVNAASLDATCNDYGYFKAKDKEEGVDNGLMLLKFKRVKDKGGFDEHKKECLDEMVKGKWRYEREERREDRRK